MRASPPGKCAALSGTRTITGCETRTPRSAVSWLRQPQRRSESNICAFSEHGQVSIELPARQLDPVLVPLLSLELHVAVEDVRPQRLSGQLRFGEGVDCLPERLGQGDDPSFAALLGGQVVEVRLHRLRQL